VIFLIQRTQEVGTWIITVYGPFSNISSLRTSALIQRTPEVGTWIITVYGPFSNISSLRTSASERLCLSLSLSLTLSLSHIPLCDKIEAPKSHPWWLEKGITISQIWNSIPVVLERKRPVI